jgi:hypothetical protein
MSFVHIDATLYKKYWDILTSGILIICHWDIVLDLWSEKKRINLLIYRKGIAPPVAIN